MNRLLFVFIILLTQPALAEYRVYELIIEDTSIGSTRTVQSTLDEYQYRAYYPLKPEETIRLGSSWFCWGDLSNHKPLCNRPVQEPVQ